MNSGSHVRRANEARHSYETRWSRQLNELERAMNSLLPRSKHQPLEPEELSRPSTSAMAFSGLGELNKALDFHVLLRELNIGSRINELSAMVYQDLQPGQRVTLALRIERSPEVRVTAVAIEATRAFPRLKTTSEAPPLDRQSFSRDNWRGTTFHATELYKPRMDENTRCSVDGFGRQFITTNFSVLERHAPSEVRILRIDEKDLLVDENPVKPPQREMESASAGRQEYSREKLERLRLKIEELDMRINHSRGNP